MNDQEVHRPDLNRPETTTEEIAAYLRVKAQFGDRDWPHRVVMIGAIGTEMLREITYGHTEIPTPIVLKILDAMEQAIKST